MNEQYTTSYTQEQRKQIIIEAYKRGFNGGYWAGVIGSALALVIAGTLYAIIF